MRQAIDISEREHQTLLVKWAHLKKIVPIHIPNEGKRGAIGGAIQLRLGLSAGFPDLIVMKAHGGYMGCCIEVKRVKEYYKPWHYQATTWQREEKWLRQLDEDGYFAKRAYGFDEGVRILELYFSWPKTEVIKSCYNGLMDDKVSDHDDARNDSQAKAIPNCS